MQVEWLSYYPYLWSGGQSGMYSSPTQIDYRSEVTSHVAFCKFVNKKIITNF